MIEKLNLAVSAGIALPLLGYLGYQPGAPQGAFAALHALLPCTIKLAAVALLCSCPSIQPMTGVRGNGILHENSMHSYRLAVHRSPITGKLIKCLCVEES